MCSFTCSRRTTRETGFGVLTGHPPMVCERVRGVWGSGGGGEGGDARKTEKKKGAAWGKHGSPHGSEPKASDAHARISTTPVEPLTRRRSPVLIVAVAVEVPTTAGIPNSRETTAG